MSDFFIAFWPNLASTVFGVGLGVPVALYLNRKLTDQSRAHEASREASLLAGAAHTLIESCDYNSRVLRAIAALSADGEVMRGPDLRTTTWDALCGIVSRHLVEPELLQLLSHHWLRLKRLEDLNTHTFSMHIGQLPLPQEPVSLESFMSELHITANDLAIHASELASKLRVVAEKMAPNHSFKTGTSSAAQFHR